jgi:hypothetical protein
MRDAYLDMDKLLQRWERLLDDDRFPRNRGKLAHYRQALARHRDAIDALLERWPVDPSQPTEL